ncbi:penicillin amidase [Brevibacterium sanguinis]|uniref:Penicillin amidase n=2 Tax=Brevibacterium TaxID=1696 RepID=A0A366IGT4_9MICO|nr:MULTISPECIES: penicillin acylase family protein [Brevibacterium]RBP63983.1 penicillin amidase [Brevibacterium sanguinis]RBP70742.1 penicillin amidase [Brevibacterium celere]
MVAADSTSRLLTAVRPGHRATSGVSRAVLLRILALVLVLITALTLLGVHMIRRSFPVTSGELVIPGLEAPVTVIRDSSGVPAIEARTAHDLFLAQGFVHAQDRFWEMDFRRHVTAGRLSELFGESQVPTDAFIRTLGWREVAEAEVAALDDTTAGYYRAYAEGVNAYLADRSPTEVSLEYGIVGLQSGEIEIEPWTPADSVSWLKAMAWDLRSNLEDEIDRAILSTTLDEEQIADLHPDYPYADRPTIIGDTATTGSGHRDEARAGGTVGTGGTAEPRTAGAAPSGTEPPAAEDATSASAGARPDFPDSTVADLAELRSTLRSLPVLLGMSGRDIGSNSWVVSGEHTASGAPLLANDPHLSPAMPSVWHQVGLRCAEVGPDCPFDVTGFSFSGLPGVVIGHNQEIAWGLTNLGPDVADLVVEKVRGTEVVHDSGSQPLRERRETIEVANGRPREITIRSTRHGPVVSDLDGTYRELLEASPGAGSPSDEERHVLALEWTALQPGTTARAVFAINQATDWDEFRAAAALFDVPAQNLLYADRAGRIGYQAPGRIPRRGEGDGTLPRAGWRSAEDWQGYHDFADLPSEFDPDRGWIVTANNPVVAPGTAVELGRDFDAGDRAARITALLSPLVAEGSITAEDFAAVQSDTANPLAGTLLPHLLDLDAPGDDRVARAQELLRSWDGHDDADSAAAAYFNIVASTLLTEVFAPKLPAATPPAGGSRWHLVIGNLLEEPESEWWRDEEVDDRDEALTRALASAWTRAEELLGPEPVTWRWGSLHALTIRNASLGESGVAVVETLVNRGPYEVFGGSGVVNATGWDASIGFETNWVPSMRQIIDLGDFDSSRWINLTGASGHAFHEHYADQVEDWAAGRTRPWAYSRQAIRESAVDTLILTPA